MSCENKLTKLVFKTERIVQEHNVLFLFLPSLFLLFIFIYLFYLYRIKKKNTYNEIHKCNAMQLLETRRKNTKTKEQGTKVTKVKAMKHKDHVRKTQLV